MLDLKMVGKRISECRKKSNYSQNDLAEILLVSRQAISNWELGIAAPTIDNLIELTKLFNVSFEFLLCLNETQLIDENDLFKNHNRDFIVKNICNGTLNINLENIFSQFNSEERMLILTSLKKRNHKFSLALLSQLEEDEFILIKRRT